MAKGWGYYADLRLKGRLTDGNGALFLGSGHKQSGH